MEEATAKTANPAWADPAWQDQQHRGRGATSWFCQGLWGLRDPNSTSEILGEGNIQDK